jgi:hypothetical protein
MPELFMTVRFRVPTTDARFDGGLVFPAGIPLHTLERRDLGQKYGFLNRLLLDPQLYLAGLNAATCSKTCANLASYGWFLCDDIPEFDSDVQKQNEWKDEARAAVAASWRGRPPTRNKDIEIAVRMCVETQVRLGCEAVILPSPLLVDASSDYTEQIEWLERGMRIARKVTEKVPRLATVAISDSCLRSIDPWSNALLDLILDHVSVREPEGVYLVLEQSFEEGYYITQPSTVASLLRLVRGFKDAGVPRVLVAGAGTAGLAAVALGADGWSTGWYRAERRIRMSDMKDEAEGRARPAYYSHALASEIHLEKDLDGLAKKGFLDELRDLTEASEHLLGALAKGEKVVRVPEWQHKIGNIQTAMEHFLLAMARETRRVSRLPLLERRNYGRAWLKRAALLARRVAETGLDLNPRTAVNFQSSWLEVFERACRAD